MPRTPRVLRPTRAIALAALLAGLGLADPASAQLAPEVGGEWGPLLAWPHVPVSMANLPDGRVLTFSSNERDAFPQGPEFTYAATWDPTSGEIVEIAHPSHDMFCASLVMLEDGSVFVSGGRNQANSPWTSLFDFNTSSWIPIEDMNQGRWYPTSVAMPGGEVVIFGGIGGEQHPEIWAPGGGWTLLTGIDLTIPMLQYGLVDGAGLWPLLQLDPRGKIFHAGATPEMHAFDPLDGLGSFVPLGPHDASWYPDEGVSVLYDAGKLLVAGGTENSTTSSDQAMVIDLSGPAPSISPAASMQEPRQFHNEVMLPTGQVLVVGGNNDGRKFNDDQAVLAPEVWDPVADTWTLLNPQAVPRTYHSTAALLVDGRVLSAGGGLDGGNPSVNHWDGEVFSPPYLFAPGGGLAVRPAISSAPGVVRVGSTLGVAATAGLAGFSMVKMSATTHTMNTDLRFLRPSFAETSAGSYEVTLHANANTLTPGYWMLFALDTSGVPSEAAVIQVVTSGEPRGKPIADRTNHVGDPVLLQVEAEDPDGNPLTYSAVGLPDGLSLDPQSGVIQGIVTQTGIYNVSVTVDDGSEQAVVAFQWFVSLAFSEVGSVQVSQANSTQWHAVAFQNVYSDPVVVMGPPSFGDAAPLTVRVDAVTSTGFEFQLDEWDYLNGSHGTETVSYVVVEAGEYVLPGGGSLVAGKSLGMTTGWRTQGLPAGAFTGGAPAVVAQLASRDGNEAATVRMRNVGPTAFDLRLREQEAGDDAVAPDDVHWIAIDAGVDPGLLEAVVTAPSVDENWDLLSFALPFSGPPRFLASIQSYDGQDTAALRHRNASASDIEILLEEEQSGDTETGHVDEVVGWLAIEPGAADLSLLPLFNQAPSLVDPGDQAGVEDDVVSLTMLANDPDGDGIGFAATGLPPGLAIDPITGEIQGTLTTPGLYAVEVTVTDPSNATGTVAFDWSVAERVHLEFFPTPPRASGTSVDYTALTDVTGSFDFTWDFGDGTPLVGPSSDPDVSHSFAAPGRFVVTLTALDPATGVTDQIQFVQMVHGALAVNPPTGSTSIAYEAGADRVWVANPDNDSVTVIDAQTHGVVQEVPVAASPRTLAFAADGRVFVTAKEGSAIEVIDPATFSVTSVPLEEGSQPHGIAFDPTGAIAFVALEGTGQVLRIDAASTAVLSSVDVGPRPRHLGVTADGTSVYVSRFVTPPIPGEHTATPMPDFMGTRYGGELLTLDAATLAPGPTVVLHHSDLGSTEFAGPGIPNYLGVPAISPDGSQIWVPSKQDNILRGDVRDGISLDFDSTVRAIVSRVALPSGVEDEVARIDHDDASMVSTALFGQTGVFLFTALEGNREISVIDALSKGELGRFPAGRAPQGLALSPDGRTLYVHNFMDRSVTVHDLDALYEYTDVTAPPLATVPLVSSEALAADVLLGKQHFYDAFDPRLASQGYMACASCHNDGGEDGRIWDFTQFGEGLRNTISLRGHGQDQGRLHWSANFDEVQDFEGQIRGFAKGSGLMDDADFEAGTTSDPLGDAKAGLSADLDALAAYVESLVEEAPSPHRAADGTLTPEALAGKVVFANAGCGGCHSGAEFSDSELGMLHDVGTLKAASGPQTVLDTPTLRGVWETAPYLHDGSAATLADATAAHAGVALPAGDLAALAAYMEQIDGAEASAPAPNTPPDVTSPGAQTNSLGDPVFLPILATDAEGDPLAYAALGLPAGLAIDALSGEISGNVGGSGGVFDVTLSVDDGLATTDVLFSWTVNTAPDVTNPGTRTDSEGDAISLQIAASDADGDPLDYAATGLPAGLAIDAVSGEISGSLEVGSAGSYAVSIDVSDGLAVSQVVFTWNVNTPPTLTDPGAQSGTVGDVVSLQIVAADAEGDPLGYAATGLPGGLAIDPVTGEISGSLAPGSGGLHAVTLSVDDGLASTQQGFSWDVNTPPSATNPGAQTHVEGEAVALQILAGDADGDLLGYSAVGLPPGLAIHPISGLVSGLLAAGSAGSYPIVTVTVSDGQDPVDLVFAWTVQPPPNQPPQVTNPGPQLGSEGDAVLLAIAASDGDGDALGFTASGLPPFLAIDPLGGVISGSLAAGSAGSYDVSVSVDDGEDVTQVDFEWTVNLPAEPAVPAEVGITTATSAGWTAVPLTRGYTSMVVVATPVYTASDPPQVIRVRNATGAGFEARVARLDGLADPVATDFHYLVVQEGSYDAATYGLQIEARKHVSSVTDSSNGWLGEDLSYLQAYAEPVVVGQVMTDNDPQPSVFWAHGAGRSGPPISTHLGVGKTVNEDPDVVRADETLGFVVVESGDWVLADRVVHAAVGPRSVRGMTNAPPYTYAVKGLLSAQVAVASLAGMAGVNGGWAVLHGPPDATGRSLDLAVDEDTLRDPERRHAAEQVGFLLFEDPSSNHAPEVTAPGDQAGFEGDVVSLQISATDLDADPLAYVASGLPDGLVIDAATGEISGTLAAASTGTHAVQVDVSDGTLQTTVAFDWNVTLPPGNVRAQVGRVLGVTNTGWTRVDLAENYASLVVVATPSYAAGAPPQIVRIRDATWDGFSVRMARRDGLTTPVATDVHFLAIEEGVYNQAEHGVDLEAVRHVSTLTDGGSSWVGEAVGYANTYVDPVVVGSVMTSNDPEPSFFWTSGDDAREHPTAAALRVGKTVTADPIALRTDETLGYVVLEAGSGSLAGKAFAAGVGGTTVRGMDNNPPYVYALPGLPSASVAVASLAGMKGWDGAWAVLHAPFDESGAQLDLVADEDQLADAERNHTHEKAAYLVFE